MSDIPDITEAHLFWDAVNMERYVRFVVDGKEFYVPYRTAQRVFRDRITEIAKTE